MYLGFEGLQGQYQYDNDVKYEARLAVVELNSIIWRFYQQTYSSEYFYSHSLDIFAGDSAGNFALETSC